MEEYFAELSRPAAAGDGENSSDVSAIECPTGLEEMGEELAEKMKKEAEDRVKLAEFMDQEPDEQEFKIKEKKRRRTTSEEEDKKIPEETKGPLTTFGHSSRPRRSVNYANIERGDEAQSQSLVTRFNTGKKRAKRTRDELDENYEDTLKKRPQQRKRIPWLPTMPRHQQTVELPREVDFKSWAPSVSAERPTEENRTVGKVLDDHVAVRRSSGGFRRFVAWLDDAMILNLMAAVERRFIVTSDTEDKRLIKSIRHVYNSMNEDYRRDWEYAAKMQIFDSRTFTGGVVSMPISEITSKEDRDELPRTTGGAVRANCCEMSPVMDDMKSVAEHFLEEHDVVHLYGCDICFKLFTSRFELTKHECNDFAAVLLEKTMKGESLELEVAYMFLCCSQCGLWLPVKTTVAGMKGWNYFATALVNHTCEPMVPVVVYFRQALPDDGKNVRMSFTFMCSVNAGLPMSCSECDVTEFKSVEEADNHFKEHKETENHVCTKCSNVEFGTDFMNRHHQLTHIAQSAQFANYLTYSATYHPPPKTRRSPHIGFKSQIPAIGGCQADELTVMTALDEKEEEFVGAHDNVMVRKLTRWKKAAPVRTKRADSDSSFSVNSTNMESSSSESESSSDEETNRQKKIKLEHEKKSRGPNGDLGYEHVNRNELLARSEEEQEAMDKCEEVLGREMFKTGEHILNPEQVLEMLKDCEIPLLEDTPSSFAEEMARLTMKTVNMPASNCIDPLKDLLLVNKIFSYCPTCKMITSSDSKVHCEMCEGQEEDLIELYHPACGPHFGIRCVDAECGKNFCSVTSLRNHCSLYHNLNINLEFTGPHAGDLQLAHRYDRSMMLLAKNFAELQSDTRTLMARFTDVECFMPFSGFLEPRVRVTPRDYGMKKMPHLQARGGLTIAPMVPIVARESALIKPYKVPRTSRWFSCAWCNREFEQNSEFVTHLVRTHMYPCQFCGKCFSNVTLKKAHRCDQAYRGDARAGNVLAGGCAVCRERFSIDLLYAHHIRRHFSSIEYNARTGEMMPEAHDLRFEPHTLHTQRPLNGNAANTVFQERTDFRLKLIKMTTSPVYGVPLQKLTTKPTLPGTYSLLPPDVKNLDSRLMCYMCELTFDDGNELTSHMEEAHPERWSHCPFCEKKVANHFELQSHLLVEHTHRSAGRVICEYCKEGHQRFMGSHLLFRCKKKPCCTICGQKFSEPQQTYAHMRRVHLNTFKRFQCAFCTTNFVSMGDYYEHTCTLQQNRVYSCICQPDLYFTSVNQFCDHFDSIHVDGNSCKICNIHAPSQENLARHRMSHVKAEAMRTAPKQVFILEKNFFPKENSAYAKWQRGGPMPSCYRNEGPVNKMARVVARPAASAQPTLFDVLEGPLAANPNPQQPARRTDVIKSGGEKLRSIENFQRPAAVSNDEVIELSEDENDDVDVVFDSRKSASPVETANGNATQITGQVRVEQSTDGYGGKQQPGYVVDDELEALEASSTPNDNEPVHKEIVDENGDDELTVVAEVEHATGTLPSSISSRREKSFKCPKCSESYYTNASLQNHIEGHKQDAGVQSCEGTYGLPTDATAFICRNCCIVFEDQEKYKRHIAIHGNTIHTCIHCSGIAFNQATITNHMAAHANKQVTYGCGTCLLKFSSDLALMAHLAKKHDVQLFYFCKICGLGSTNANRVFEHLTTHLRHSYSLMQRFGACPVQLLNYEPADEQDFRLRVQSKMIHLVEPSDCSHRTMLLSNETVLSCKTCHCTQPWFNYLAFNGYSEETGFPHFRIVEQDPHTPFPLAYQLNSTNAQNMMRFGNSTNATLGHLAHAHAAAIPASTATTRTYERRGMLPPHRQPLNLRGTPIAPVVTTMSNGARVIRPSGPAAHGAMREVVPSRSLPGRRVIVRTVGAVATPTANEEVPIQVRPAMQGNKCGDCQKTFSTSANDFDRHLHKMHRSPDTWLCRQCGNSEDSELKLFLHYVNDHLKPAYHQHRELDQLNSSNRINRSSDSRSPQFKANVFKLRCPVAACKEAEFMSAKTFQRHMSTHPVLLPHASENCDARFATKELQISHDKKHIEFLEANGTDATCCPICGTLDMWSLSKDAETDCLQSHIIRHGLDYRSACRGCLQQFPADVHLTSVLKHMTTHHAMAVGTITCEICGETDFETREAFYAHCEKRHVFHMLLKPIRSTKGELVVTTGLEFQSFVGLKPAGAATTTSGAVAYKVRPAVSKPVTESGASPLMTIAAAIGEEQKNDKHVEEDDDVQALD